MWISRGLGCLIRGRRLWRGIGGARRRWSGRRMREVWIRGLGCFIGIRGRGRGKGGLSGFGGRRGRRDRLRLLRLRLWWQDRVKERRVSRNMYTFTTLAKIYIFKSRQSSQDGKSWIQGYNHYTL